VARDEVDETDYACPCGAGEIHTYFSSPNHAYGKCSSGGSIRCSECSKRYRLPDRLPHDADEVLLTPTADGLEGVRLGTLKKLRTRSNY